MDAVVRDVRQSVAKGDMSAAQKRLDKEMSSSASPADKEGLAFLDLWLAYKDTRWNDVITKSDAMLATTPLLEEEVRAFRADALAKAGRRADAFNEDKRLMEMAPNFLLRFESQMRTGRSYLNEGKANQAQTIFRALEKRARGTPGYSEVLMELARAEKKASHGTHACRWLLKLYKQNPMKSEIRGWGPDLAANEVDGVKTGCRSSIEDFRDRVRAFIWAGEEDRAREEVQVVANAIASENRGQADELRAWFLLQQGEVDQSFQMLEALAPQHPKDHSFLMTYASAAARSGHGSEAVAAYTKAWQLNRNGKDAKKALYQAAFLSYQFQDYDGASRKFREFIQLYSRSGLSEDARWNLAWISYLKGDFEQAYKNFSDIRERRGRRVSVKERAKYWMAMSLLRLNRLAEAKLLFESLAGDRSGTYYSFAARHRLNRLTSQMPQSALLAVENRFYGSWRFGEVLRPTAESRGEFTVNEETESEETLAAEMTEAADAMETAGKEDNEVETSIESVRSDVDAPEWSAKAPANARRMDKARALLRLGFNEDAKWELFEVERRSRSRDEMRALMGEYVNAGQWNRASSIAQLRFANVRTQQGMEGARNVWEAAYPRAFESDVRDTALKSGLPEEFIWGLMRAESQYRRDAVSPVGALGLMQIMPGTGRKLASLQGEKNFQPLLLLEPTTAIHYGGTYLQRLSRGLDSSLPLMAAAYNAGPHRVHSWLISFGSALDTDEFIEHIPFLETREYVRKVMANSFIYRQLYGIRSKGTDLAAPLKVKGILAASKKETWDPL